MAGSVPVIAVQEPALGEEENAAAREDRFAALVNRQARFVFRLAYAILRNVHDAEDVAQETFLKLYRLRAWECIVDERAFLARTAWRIAADRHRKRPSTVADSDTASGDPSPEQAAMAAEANAVVWRLIDALPEELRQPLALSTLEELTSREIAEVMGIPDATVRTRLMRARRILKQKLSALRAGPHEQ